MECKEEAPEAAFSSIAEIPAQSDSVTRAVLF